MVYVIAEIGINHNGSLENAIKLIDIAKEAGCDCVKFQKRDPDVCVPDRQKLQPKVWQGKEMTYIEYKHLLEFGVKEYNEINAYCKEKNIQWTASVWDVDSAFFMGAYKKDIPFIKIPSACITDYDLIKQINCFDIPVIISAGMSMMREVCIAALMIDNLKGIMHCNSSYPAKIEQLDLRVIPKFKEIFKEQQIGYSGHEEGILPSLIAAAQGAEIIERHITLDKNMEGSDHRASLEKDELKLLVDNLKNVELMLGNDFLTVYPEEEVVKRKLRKW